MGPWSFRDHPQSRPLDGHQIKLLPLRSKPWSAARLSCPLQILTGPTRPLSHLVIARRVPVLRQAPFCAWQLASLAAFHWFHRSFLDVSSLSCLAVSRASLPVPSVHPPVGCSTAPVFLNPPGIAVLLKLLLAFAVRRSWALRAPLRLSLAFGWFYLLSFSLSPSSASFRLSTDGT